MPLKPPGDLIVVVHPQSKYQLTAGPLQLPTTLSTKEKAEKILPYILQAFLNEPQGQGKPVELRAPWSWSTTDARLAAALEPLFVHHGFSEELRRVEVCTEDEKSIADACWDELLGRLVESVSEDARRSGVQLGDDTKCHRCQKSSSDAASPLMKCAACKKAWYCSPPCQKAHWKQHKPACIANRPSAAGIEALNFYKTMAHKCPEAKALAATLNLDLPTSASAQEGTV